MRVQDLYSPGAQVARPDQALAEAARTMLQSHVGSLVVVQTRGADRRPVGILTDRDIVRGQLRLSADLFCLTVGDVMTPDPLTIDASAGVTEAIESLHTRGVRRAPVVDGTGNLLGIVTLDDLLPAVARELEELATLLGTQARHERKLTA
ncbi:MAG: CBS domain-containing protein [Gammaproteobacteria bacterium]|nr:CBS domain-containing protein [Gammaproteobacteria bacterium]MDE2263136.1 CBS domain-containing protein [Gammaproteobacteria bacterium]